MVEDLNSTAAKVVMGMGYRQEDVENANKLAREKYSSTELRAQYIPESLIDNSYSSSDDSGQSNNNHTGREVRLEAAGNILDSKPVESNDKTTDINEERQKLLEENRQLKNQMICKICLDKDACINNHCVSSLWPYGFLRRVCARVKKMCCLQNTYKFKELSDQLNQVLKSSMHKEWTRYQSFKNFPQSSSVSPIRLAKAGFYHTGTGEDTTCFSCRLTVATWTSDETVSELHRRLSPRCLHLSGQDRTNVPIHGESCLEQTNLGASSVGNVPTRNSSSDMTLEQRTVVTRANGSSEDEGSFCVSGVRANQRHMLTASQATGQIEYYPGITTEKPKHPDYAIKSVRMSSFTGRCPIVMDQEQLAEAGFFYTGVQDCVRCFFCGGGMKDWENGDNAWIEHARWCPNCAYVKQVKGEHFISMCRMANIDYMTADGGMQNLATTGFDLEGGGNVVEDQMVEDLNSTAAKVVMGMGYRQEDVENAIKLAREKYSSTELRAQCILESLLVNSYSSSGDNVQSSNNYTGREVRLEAAGNILDNKPVESNDRSTDINEERQKLLEENRQLKNQMICKICLDKDACIVFLPCGHMVSCVECAHALRKCAVCRALIQGTVRAYPA